jgi:hypothetical protein
MNRSRFSKCGRAVALVAAVAAVLLVVRARASGPDPQVSGKALLEQAVKAETELRFDTAADRLYRLLIEQPRAPEAAAARMVLGRLLALSGDLAGALAEYQSLRDELPPEHPLRATEIGVATTVARRLRATTNTASYFKGMNLLSAKGLPTLNDPTSVDVHPSGAILLVDSGNGLAYRVDGETAMPIAGMQEIAAATFMPDGTIAVAGKTGIAIGTGKPAVFGGTWGGRARQVKKVRALASMAGGDLLVVDRDYDGLLRCKPSAATCAPWGPVGKLRTVKVGVSDFVYLLDDHQQSVHVVDQGGRSITTIGPVLGSMKLGEVVDLAVDSAYGIYLADKQTRRVLVLTLRSGVANAVTAETVASVILSPEGERSIKNPSALGVTPDGALVVAGRSVAHLFKFE